jgi:hypothetical protein
MQLVMLFEVFSFDFYSKYTSQKYDLIDANIFSVIGIFSYPFVFIRNNRKDLYICRIDNEGNNITDNLL